MITSLILLQEALVEDLDGFDKLLTAVRSKGLRIVAAIQDISQIEETYGRAFTQTFFGAFGTVLAGVASGDTAAFLARAYGQNQIARTVTSHTSADRDGGDSSTVTETVVIENALLDSEFSGLTPPGPGRPAVFWLKTAGWPIGPVAYWTKPTPKLYPPERPNDRLTAHRQQPAAAADLTLGNKGDIARFKIPLLTKVTVTNEGTFHE